MGLGRASASEAGVFRGARGSLVAVPDLWTVGVLYMVESCARGTCEVQFAEADMILLLMARGPSHVSPGKHRGRRSLRP